jgi:hypothetical protein
MLPEMSKAQMSQVALLKVIKREPAIPFKGGKQLGEEVGKIEFKNVKFNYPSRPNVTVLKDFSLDIRVGQSIALVTIFSICLLNLTNSISENVNRLVLVVLENPQLLDYWNDSMIRKRVIYSLME